MTAEEMRAKVAELNLEIGNRNAELEAARANFKACIMDLVKQRDELVAQLAAGDKLDKMSPAERAAVARLIQPTGIPSAEAIGNLGK